MEMETLFIDCLGYIEVNKISKETTGWVHSAQYTQLGLYFSSITDGKYIRLCSPQQVFLIMYLSSMCPVVYLWEYLFSPLGDNVGN